MIYREWSDEFGKRLQEITGIESSFFKLCFYDTSSTVPEYKYFIVEDDFILPIVEVIDRYTKTKIPIVLGDAFLNQADLFFNQNLEKLTNYNLKVIPNSRQEYVVPLLSNFNEYKRSVSRVSRCFNKCKNKLEHYIYKGMHIGEEHIELCKQYSKYWFNKDNTYTFTYEFAYNHLKQLEKVSPCYTIEIKDDYKTLALGYFEIINNNVYWHKTIRNVSEEYEKFSVGNYVLLKALEELCYPKQLPLNLGVSWFDYKKHWHPVEKQIRGISFINEV